MNITAIIAAMAVTALSGMAVGLALGLFAERFKVEENPLIEAIRQCLPGANCGGCGYAGCNACAKAIAKGEAKANACAPGGNETAERIAALIGDDSVQQVRQMTAFVRCGGTCDKTSSLYEYTGIRDCVFAMNVPGHGGKSCRFGCIGFGSCMKVCSQNAIHIEKGIAKVDESLCIGCGQCVKACPAHIIDLVPKGWKAEVACSSTDRAKKVLHVCTAGCIGCSLCQKKCPEGAVIFENNLAHIDFEKCTGCGICVSACPRGAIAGAPDVLKQCK